VHKTCRNNLHFVTIPNNVYTEVNNVKVGRGSSVGTATGYGLDGPEIEFRWR